MSTIPASQIASAVPGVIQAGGDALDLIATVLTRSTRVPVGTFLGFPDATAVGDFFGLGSNEAALAAVYFDGYEGATALPGSINFVQYPGGGASAYLRGGNAAAALTLAQLQGISGTLTVVFDGYSRTGSAINLSSASSFSAAATTIATGLNGSLATEASFTAAIAAEAFSVTGSISGNVLTVTSVGSGTIIVGAAITGTGVTANSFVEGQLTGTAGGVGTYAVNIAQGVPSTTISGSYGQLTVSAVGSGVLGVGQTVIGGSTLAGTIITALGNGTGSTGTYFVNLTQTVGSTALTTEPTPVAVTFDSQFGAFIVTSGVNGALSSAAFATGGIAANLLLTSATGAVLSQGAAPATPAAFMNGVVGLTTNWATFFTAFDPDGGNGNSQKLAFASWNATQNGRWLYAAADNDITPTQSVPAAASLGRLLVTDNLGGTAPIYEPSNLFGAAFLCGTIASINFDQPGGAIVLAGRTQSGLTAGVTTGTAAANLGGNPQAAGSFGNGYNFVGAYGTANEQFIQFQRGTVSGDFQWIDGYIYSIWLTNALQLAVMELFAATPSIPFNPAGQTTIETALADGPIADALSFGAIQTGVTLSSTEIAAVNNAAGLNVASVLATRGWYLSIPIPPPSVRASRGPWGLVLYYVYGGSVQSISLGVIEVE